MMPADAERVAPAQLTRAHVPHPRIAERFDRSALLIGARGAGKTFLLRYRQENVHPGAVHISLPRALSSITEDAGLSGRTAQYLTRDDGVIRAKTAALIAVRAAATAAERTGGELRGTLNLFRPLLERSLWSDSRATAENLDDLFHAVVALPLRSWTTSASRERMREVVESIDAAMDERLMLFLDRADDVSHPSVAHLLGLLDQSCSVITVIAARPGVAQVLSAGLDRDMVPDDHYDMVHVGTHPYDADWQAFVDRATRNFLDESDMHVADDFDLRSALLLARDSVRDAAAFAQIAVATPEARDMTRRREMYVEKQRSKVLRVNSLIRPDHDDYYAFVRYVTKQVEAKLARGRQKALVITVDREFAQVDLFEETRDRTRQFILAALRAEALHFPHGYAWHPFSLPDEYELPPLLVLPERNNAWIR